MNEQAQEDNAGGNGAGSMMVAVAVALLIAGVAAYYVLDTRPDWQRWGAAGLGLLAAICVFALSPLGRRSWQFALDSRVELRKVVWPSRQETLQTTAVVFGFIVLAGLFFWVLDLVLAWATRLLTGQGG
ncbi:MAG TPA: preprotein translocase subunit SecE [Steroidobacteraceae bacterium]|jgi:preprotein translocase subunit SecE|nr:preprotein translocase subunit SecE [Steroidobacteraceae bacterium]